MPLSGGLGQYLTVQPLPPAPFALCDGDVFVYEYRIRVALVLEMRRAIRGQWRLAIHEIRRFKPTNETSSRGDAPFAGELESAAIVKTRTGPGAAESGNTSLSDVSHGATPEKGGAPVRAIV